MTTQSTLIRIRNLIDNLDLDYLEGYELTYDANMPGYILHNDVEGIDLGDSYESAKAELEQLSQPKEH